MNSEYCYKLTYTTGECEPKTEYFVRAFNRDYFYFNVAEDKPVTLVTEDGLYFTNNLRGFVNREVYREKLKGETVGHATILEEIEELSTLGEFCEMEINCGILRAEVVNLPKIDIEATKKKNDWSSGFLSLVYINGEPLLKDGMRCSIGYWHFYKPTQSLCRAILKLLKQVNKDILDLHLSTDFSADSDCDYFLEIEAKNFGAIKEVLMDLFGCTFDGTEKPVSVKGLNGEVQSVKYFFHMIDCSCM